MLREPLICLLIDVFNSRPSEGPDVEKGRPKIFTVTSLRMITQYFPVSLSRSLLARSRVRGTSRYSRLNERYRFV